MMVALTTTLSAQTAREEIAANKYLAASNYLDYDRQMTTTPLTPAPAGYTPFYMSHYGTAIPASWTPCARPAAMAS